jgi:hypothetical protein
MAPGPSIWQMISPSRSEAMEKLKTSPFAGFCVDRRHVFDKKLRVVTALGGSKFNLNYHNQFLLLIG